MNLSKKQIEQAEQVWQNYVTNGEKFINASRDYSDQELDQLRKATIPEVMGWLYRFEPPLAL